jgi:endo-beta-N-acetylglucosaminidase D
MGQSLGIVFQLEKLNNDEIAELFKWEKSVKEKYILKRELTKRNPYDVSLSTD